MKNRKYFILVSLVIISFYCKAQTIYVDSSNNTGIEYGTAVNPFNTIKEGIAVADPGDTVFIRQGTYFPDESLSGTDSTLFLKAGVKLIGEGADKSIVDGYIVDASVSTLPIGIEKLRFKAFSFARGTIAGPFAGQSIIRNCKTGLIAIVHGKSIPVNDTTPGLIYGFVIENNDLGEGFIEFKQGPGVAENRVSGNTAGYIELASGAGFTYFIDDNDVHFGILDRSGACKTTISNNRIFNGAIIDKSGGGGYGAEDEIIENNVITATENSPVFIDEDYKAGINASSRSVTIRGNTITCAGNISGIRSLAGAPTHILNNIITIDEVQQPNPDPYEGTSGILNYSGWGYVTGNKIHGGNIGYYSKAGTVEFADNAIENSYTGFYSMGAEVVHNNTITNCKGDGMLLDGLRGPLYSNIIKNNAGSGIRILRMPIDLGGGKDNCPGLNQITGNGNYDLYIGKTSTQFPVLYARYNVWDHTDTLDIMQYDIYDGNDSAGLVGVDFTPAGYLGIENAVSINRLKISPNPFSQSASITWVLTKRSIVSLNILDLTGKVIKILVNEQIDPGDHQVVFDAANLTAGMYLCQLKANGRSVTKKMIITG